MKKSNPAGSFYEIQRRQKTRTLFLLIILCTVYFAFLGALYGLFYIFFLGMLLQKAAFSAWHIGVILILSMITAFLQWYDARKSGADFVLKRLNAQVPDENDLYHKRLLDIVEEMRIATGLPRKVRVYIISANAINSFALMDSDGAPVIGMTEGALARLTREEIQAATAHELAHILNGDALYVTFVCSIGNMFQKLVDSLEGQETQEAVIIFGGNSRLTWVGPQFSGFILSFFVFAAFRVWSLLISRQREYLADAAAAEMTRNPEAIARAIYKAHTHYSFLGDGGELYSPIFIVAPGSQGSSSSPVFLEDVVSTHPPVQKRIEQLIAMSSTPMDQFLKTLDEEDGLREKNRATIKSIDEIHPAFPGEAEGKVLEIVPGETSPGYVEGKGAPKNLWEVRDQNGIWKGPFHLDEIFNISWFTGQSMIRIAGTTEQKQARFFPEVLGAFSGIQINESQKGYCPECGARLVSSRYEGVSIRSCPRCGGKMIPETGVMRIICRREVKPSPRLLEKAHQWKTEHSINPLIKKKRIEEISKDSAGNRKRQVCPLCGRSMYNRIFSYQYFIEIAECGICKSLWFKGDELEILQILIEEAGY
jgi:heat shock protein HtpX